MKKSKYIIGILLISLTFGLKAQNPIDEYLIMAAKNNPGLQASFNDYLASLEKMPQVKSLPDPQLAFAYFIQPVETRMGPQRFKISITQAFPWFGILETKEDIEAQKAKAKLEVFLDKKQRLFYEVKNSYFNVFLTNKAIEVTEKNIEILHSFHRLALIKIEAGKTSIVDEYRIEMELGELENQLALLNDNLQFQLTKFSNLLNISSIKSMEIPQSIIEEEFLFTKSIMLDSIRTQNHQLLKLEIDSEVLKLKKYYAKQIGKPDFSFGVDYINIGKGENNLEGKDALILPKIGVSIPLYRNKYKAMINEVAYMETAKEYEKTEKFNGIEILFENSFKNYQDAKRRLVLYASQTDLAKKSLVIMETEYATDSKNFEELLKMERQLLKYELALEKARVDKQASLAFVNYLMGK